MNKRVVMVSLLSLLVVMAWYLGNMYLRQRHPEWYEPQGEQTAGQNEPPAPAATQGAAQPSTQAVVQPQPQSQPTIKSTPILAVGGEGRTATIGSGEFDAKGEKSDFVMGGAIDPQGAAISSVTLNRLRAGQGKDKPYVFQKPYRDLDPQRSRSMVTQAIFVDGQKVELHDK